MSKRSKHVWIVDVIENDPEAKKKALDRSAKQVSRKSKNDRGGDIQL